MALTPIDETHALQIQAGTLGRKAGHAFEDGITEKINSLNYPLKMLNSVLPHVSTGDPAISLLHYISVFYKSFVIESAVAISTGALATSEEGKKWLEVNGVRVKRCKSDLILTIEFADSDVECTVGVSTKDSRKYKFTSTRVTVSVIFP